jgi:hypothetical protein
MSLPDQAKWGWRDLVMLLVLFLAATVALWWFWARAPHPSSDTTMAIYRAFEVDRSIQQRLLYPRWAMDFNFTYGAPLLEYRPPLVHYLLPLFNWVGLGWIDAARATATLELLLAASGMYVYGRYLFGGRRPAFIAAAAYLLAPYLLADINERGAIGEAMALALLPWLFWSTDRALSEDGRFGPWLAALFAGLLVLAHNIVAFIAMPVLVFYVVMSAWHDRSWRRVPALAAAVALGLGLSAFYWLPAFLERDSAQIVARMGLNISQWLAPLWQWVQSQVTFDYSGDLRFRLALWQALVLAGATVRLFLWRGRLRFRLAVFAGIAVCLLLLQLQASLFLWTAVPLTQYIQFPWRLLGIVAFCIAILAGSLFTWRPLTGSAGWLAIFAVAGIMLWAGTARLAPQFRPDWGQIAETQISLDGLFDRGRSYFTVFSDFLPSAVKVNTTDLPMPRAPGEAVAPPMTYVPDITVTRDGPARLDLKVHAEQPFTLRLHRFFFPGWQVYADGKTVPTGPSGDLGLVTAGMPAGDYAAAIRFEETPVRRAADIISVVCLAIWLAIGIATRPARPVLIGFAFASAAAIVLLFARHGTGQALRQPTPYAVTFQGEIRLLGYDLPDKDWRPGDDIPLNLYWLATQAPERDYKVFIHVIEPDDSARVAQSDSAPILGYSPTSRWEPGEIIVDEHLVHLDETIPPGIYKLLIGLYDPETLQNLPVRDSPQVLPGDRVMLAEFNVN